MKTGTGGFVHRIMPPIDHHFGDIPQACYDKSLTRGQIERMLLDVYLQEDNVMRLMETDDCRIWATMAIQLVAEIDAETIFWHNYFNEDI